MTKTKQKDSLGNRIKENYENRSKTKLVRRTPVIIRLDGKAFHTFLKGFEEPFDDRFLETMRETTLELCKNIQGCVFGYTQSDEISLVLVDYSTITTDAWFDYEVQKLCSISASMATLAFNRIFAKKVNQYIKENTGNGSEEVKRLISVYKRAVSKGGLFDSRCFNVPVPEVVNTILWRQIDARRNSILSVAQVNFSHKEMYKKSCSELKDMLVSEKNVDWDALPNDKKIGVSVLKDEYGKWFVDREFPMLLGEDRRYLEDLVNLSDE